MKILLAILFGLGITQSIVLMVVSFLPSYVEENYSGINLTEVGIILRYIFLTFSSY
jgi:hypothetical protein